MEPDAEAHLSWKHFVSGAIAGTAEHTGLYPADLIKTHQQSVPEPVRAAVVARDLVRAGGVRALFRGVATIAAGAAPAHAVYFAAYERVLHVGVAQGVDARATASPLRLGAVATLGMDLLLAPVDALKQRRQLLQAQCRSTWALVRTVRRTEGLGALYKGYAPTVVMNVPYHALYMNLYEPLSQALAPALSSAAHLAAGAVAGAVAAAVTTPLDVARTRLQTQAQYTGLLQTLRRVWREEGAQALLRGAGPRMLFHGTSGAILWGTYEWLKQLLRADAPSDTTRGTSHDSNGHSDAQAVR